MRETELDQIATLIVNNIFNYQRISSAKLLKDMAMIEVQSLYPAQLELLRPLVGAYIDDLTIINGLKG